MPRDLPWRAAIERVLQEEPGALDYNAITQKIIEDGLRTNLGATPNTTVAGILSTSIKNDGEASPFVRIGRGLYIWKQKAAISQPLELSSADENEEEQTNIISSFGIFWRRENIEWGNSTKLLGMQEPGATPVDFSTQIGIYLLYDGREVIYVGRATDRPLGKRLYEHTLDRHATRWDRFSWFGVKPVNDNGQLGTMKDSFNTAILLPGLEAILIEALEPRQNRKRGDDLSSMEYIQKQDPEIRKKMLRQAMDDALNNKL